MSTTDYLYLIKTIEDNKVQLVTKIEIADGVTVSDGKICAVLKRYTPPVDMSEALADIQKFSTAAPSAGQRLGKNLLGKYIQTTSVMNLKLSSSCVPIIKFLSHDIDLVYQTDGHRKKL